MNSGGDSIGERSFTPKQREVWRATVETPHRYNISVGAVRSGKTYIDLFRIPKRLRMLGEDDNAAFIGNTAGSLERNIFAPLRKLWGARLVGSIGGNGNIRLFGRDCYAFGADRNTAAEKIRGMSLSYCYGDEITTWSETVFRMIQSRLDREDSVFDGTCNPDAPDHWFRKFLDSGADIYLSEFTIDDNPRLPPQFVKSLKDEYRGTVYYDRYILGKWRSCDGVIYRAFADDPEQFIIDRINERIIMADVGVDFGGNGSAHAFNLTGYTAGYRKVITLAEYYNKSIISPSELERDFAQFIRKCREEYPVLRDVYCDSAEQVLIRGLKNTAARERLGVEIHNARKGQISDRIRFYTSIMGQGRYFVMRNCKNTVGAFMSAQWDSGTRLDNGSSNIDSLDAQEYSTEKRMNDILDRGGAWNNCTAE